MAAATQLGPTSRDAQKLIKNRLAEIGKQAALSKDQVRSKEMVCSDPNISSDAKRRQEMRDLKQERLRVKVERHNKKAHLALSGQENPEVGQRGEEEDLPQEPSRGICENTEPSLLREIQSFTESLPTDGCPSKFSRSAFGDDAWYQGPVPSEQAHVMNSDQLAHALLATTSLPKEVLDNFASQKVNGFLLYRILSMKRDEWETFMREELGLKRFVDFAKLESFVDMWASGALDKDNS